MVGQPYFMKNKDWYIVDENDNYVLTKLAPKEAIEDYNRQKSEYNKKIKGMNQEEYVEFLLSEDSWLSFPLY